MFARRYDYTVKQDPCHCRSGVGPRRRVVSPMSGTPTHAPAAPAELSALAHHPVLDALDYAVVVTDLRGVITFWNPHATTLYGWSEAEALGVAARELLVPELARAQGDAIVARLRAGGSWFGEFFVRRN